MDFFTVKEIGEELTLNLSNDQAGRLIGCGGETINSLRKKLIFINHLVISSEKVLLKFIITLWVMVISPIVDCYYLIIPTIKKIYNS